MPISEKKAANALGMIDLYPGRRKYFDALLDDLETWEIAGAVDPSAAIDAYAARLIEHIGDLGEHSQVGGYPGYWTETAESFEEAWREGGFSEPTIRETTFKLLRGLRLFSNDRLKYLVYAVFGRRGVMLDELEAMGAYFQAGIRRQDLEVLDFLADQTDEMDGKRYIDHLVTRSKYALLGVPQVSEDMLTRFLDTQEGYELRLFGAVDWWCNDGNYSNLSGRYAEMFKPILNEYRRDPAYQKYLKEPMGYCRGALERWLRLKG